MDSKFGDLYENPEGANLGNECVVQGGVSAPEFVDEVIAQFRTLAFFLSFGGVFFGHRKMLCDAVEFTGSCGPALEKGSVDEEVGIAPNGGGEVRVMVLRQSEMTLGSGCVARPRQGAEKSNLKCRSSRGSVEACHHPLNFSV